MFAKNSDRPPGEVQVVERHGRRPPTNRVHTQYLDLEDEGAQALVGSRPTWMWGFEHAVNESGVAVGNERVWTRLPASEEPRLVGMDLVRLAAERACSAEEAVTVIGECLERHGQGGVADAFHGEAYNSSFLVADRSSAWVLDTMGSSWVASEVDGAEAISNRLSLGPDWSRSSADVPRGHDVSAWRDSVWDPVADVRLACTRPYVHRLEMGLEADEGAARLVALMRHHGGEAWGAPLKRDRLPDPPPLGGGAVTVCMHVDGVAVTAASMVCWLPADPAEPVRGWFALGAPCVSVYVPVVVGAHVPRVLTLGSSWRAFDALRRLVERRVLGLPEVRERLDPIEDEGWAAASELAAAGDWTASSWQELGEKCAGEALAAARSLAESVDMSRVRQG